MMNWIRGLGREVDLAGFGALGHGGLDHTLCAAKVRSAVFGFLNGSRNAFRLLGRAARGHLSSLGPKGRPKPKGAFMTDQPKQLEAPIRLAPTLEGIALEIGVCAELGLPSFDPAPLFGAWRANFGRLRAQAAGWLSHA